MRLTLFLGALVATLKLTNAWPNRSYKTEKFRTPEFKFKTPGNRATAPGYLFVGLVHGNKSGVAGPIIVENNGELVWQGPREFPGYYNFQTQDIGGRPHLTWWSGHLERTGHGYGRVVIMDDTYKVTKTICLPHHVNIVGPEDVESPHACFIDKHESLITNRNSIIVTAYNVTKTDLRALGGPKEGWIYDCLFFELSLEDNSVLFKWSAIEHVPITKSHFVNSTGPHPLFLHGKFKGNDRSEPWDFFHINSVQNIEGGYLVNSRMTWSFYKVENPSGKVEWTLEGSHGGDFKMQDKIFFSWQHHPRLQYKIGPNLHIHLFNNDNIGRLAFGKNVSTGYMLRVNPVDKRVSSVYNVHAQPFTKVYSRAEGSQQGLPNSHHLLGYGSKAFIEEYDHRHKLIYASQFGAESARIHSYRTYRLPWKGRPTSSPKLVAELREDGRIIMHMSWNGATDYTGWRVYAGRFQFLLFPMYDTVKRTGFETRHVINKGRYGYRFIQVKAIGPEGQVLGASRTVAVPGRKHTP